MEQNKIDFIRENFYKTWDWAIRDELIIGSDESSPQNRENAFQLLYDIDPTRNKKYLDWLRCLHKNNLKQYKSKLRGFSNTYLPTFWEDIQAKLPAALELYHVLKKTKVIELKDREISKFKNPDDFILFMHWFQIKSGADDAEIMTLNHREIAAVTNYHKINHDKHNDNNNGIAEILHDGDVWLVVRTYDYKANSEFGKYTLWCTSKHSHTFDNYNRRGGLFILIKKGFGSSASTKKDPETRLQFHFEDGMFMNALDKRINVSTFFKKNDDVRAFFKSYVINNVIPSLSKKSAEDAISLLLDLGYGEEIVKILKSNKPQKLNLENFDITDDVIEHLGDVASLEEINLSNNNITNIPTSFQNLHKLKSLQLRSNNITTIPEWLLGLPSLNKLDVSYCNVSCVTISTLCNISVLCLNNNKHLIKLPERFDLMPNLKQLNANTCDIKEIPNSVLSCGELQIIDVCNNQNLTHIPTQIASMPKIIAILIDDTKISDIDVGLMHEIKTDNIIIIKYNKN